jgi:hypothetical protein
MSTVAQEPGPATHSEVELRHELAVAFHDLGSAAFALALHGALQDKRLAPRVQRVYELDAQLAAHARLTATSERQQAPVWTGRLEIAA